MSPDQLWLASGGLAAEATCLRDCRLHRGRGREATSTPPSPPPHREVRAASRGPGVWGKWAGDLNCLSIPNSLSPPDTVFQLYPCAGLFECHPPLRLRHLRLQPRLHLRCEFAGAHGPAASLLASAPSASPAALEPLASQRPRPVSFDVPLRPSASLPPSPHVPTTPSPPPTRSSKIRTCCPSQRTRWWRGRAKAPSTPPTSTRLSWWVSIRFPDPSQCLSSQVTL